MTPTTSSASNYAHTTPERGRALRPWWAWVITFAAFPPAGYLGRVVAGRVDTAFAALLAGVTTGAVLGVGQWLLLRRRGVSFRWAAATAVALGVGLMAGAAVVSYDTGHLDLAVMGAVSGLAVGLAQAAAIGSRHASTLVWGATTAALWALGWQLTSGVIEVADQWPIFGASGALVVTFLQSTFIERVLPLGNRAAVTAAAS